MGTSSPFVPLLLITALAVAVPLLASRLRTIKLPVVVGEIAAGMVIGQSGFDVVEHSETLDFLAEFGFTFLMFLSGLEVNFEILFGTRNTGERRRWQGPVPLAGIVFASSVFLSMIAGTALVLFGMAKSPILMGLILSTTSLGIVVPVLKERSLTTTAFGQALLAAALISDFATLLLLSLTIAVLSEGLSLELLLFMILLAAFLAVGKLGQWAVRNRFLTTAMDELSHATAQLQVRGAFALMITWVVLSQILGVEVLLGAFLAGAVISLSSPRHESPLKDKLDAIGFGFFIPIFFIMVGANFDLRSLLASHSALALVPLLIVAAYLVKIVPALLLRLRFTWSEALGAGVLLSSRLSLIIAASAIALNLNLITPATNAAVVVVAVVTCTLSPIVFARLVPAPKDERRRGIIIYGTTQGARLLATRIVKSGETELTFVSRNEDELRQLQEEGFKVVSGDPQDPSVLEKAGAATARAFVAMPNVEDKLVCVCRVARDRFAVPQIIARSSDVGLLRELQAMGVKVVQPTMATALALEGALHFPASFSMLMDQNDDVDVVDAELTNSSISGRPLRQVRLPGDVLIMGIRRQGEVIVPHGNTVLQKGDVLMLVGSPSNLRTARAFLDASAEG